MTRKIANLAAAGWILTDDALATSAAFTFAQSVGGRALCL